MFRRVQLQSVVLMIPRALATAGRRCKHILDGFTVGAHWQPPACLQYSSAAVRACLGVGSQERVFEVETLSMAPAKTVRSSTQSYGGGSQCLYARLVFLPCLLCAGCYAACQTKGSTQKSQEQ